VSVEAGLADMLVRMETGRFKVLKHLNDWFEEFRLYHRKDGRGHKEGDDLMSATSYACMMLRFARSTLPSKPRLAGAVPIEWRHECRSRTRSDDSRSSVSGSGGRRAEGG
jgi:hypothetical protein